MPRLLRRSATPEAPSPEDDGPAVSSRSPLRGLGRVVTVAWSASSLTAALLWAEFLAGTLHPWGWTFVALAGGAIGATIAAAMLGLWRIARGPARLKALGLVIAGLAPAGLVVALVLIGAAQ